MASGMFVEVIKEVGLCLWHSGSKCLVHIRDLKENLNSLEVTVEQLMQIYEDVQQRVQTEELLPLAKRTCEVAGWFDGVRKLNEDVSKTLQDGKEQEQNKCLAGYCPKNCWRSYKLGKRVREMLDEVEKMKNNGRFDIVVAKMHNPVNKKPMDETMGLDPMLQKVWRCIEDKSLRVIGLYGIGGVGKTTLLHRINNLFLSLSHDFVEVILVSVSKEPDVKNIQNTILQKLGLLEGSRFVSIEENATLICRRLEERKFLLLLDDIWEWLDLNLVGIPLPDDQNESKVIFTTRLEEVCGLMGAQQNIKVECLTQEEALRLFRMKVGENTLNSDPRIPKLAEDMAAECKGLPLALVTVGRAMASRKDPEDWESEIAALRNTPSEFPGMDSVLLPLKFSFEKLQNATFKSCFLYCCLFPDGYNIRKEELIEYWRAERLLDEYYHDEEYIIRSLERACLLESGESEEFVKMHGLIRDMAWWECRDKVAIFIKRDAESDEERGLSIWNGVERLSLWDYSIDDVLINSSPSCIEHFCKNVKQLPNLRTMICKVPLLTTFPAGFFPLMSALTLLDLSNSFLLRELPKEIGKLINLEYLNVSETAITELPDEIQYLEKLRCLILNGTNIPEIQRGLISRFQFLEIFSRFGDKYFSYSEVLEDLVNLPHLSEICIAITSDTAIIQRLMSLERLQRCIRKLSLFACDELTSLVLSPTSLYRMEHLELRQCSSLREVGIETFPSYRMHKYFDQLSMFGKIRRVVIGDCGNLRSVTWLIYAPKLETLDLRDCKNLREIIGFILGDEAEIKKMSKIFIFSSLKVLRLVRLPVLHTIYQYVLSFPLLRKIEVLKCHSLERLPFDSKSAENCLIHGEEKWWDRLDWADEATKQVFSSKFFRHSWGDDDDEDVGASSSAI
ncbi:disease resistance protein SUMM2-like [Quercus robur]|uniref:disease resistance protein SUMM2-like n=1 Tax=Quercus robur TaxID=38942 RepID=UPI002161814E|nr:disease resistance protein SUMM2-like [Quercus robur]